MKKIEIRDFLDFKYVSNPGFSPDGKCAAFIVQTASLEDNQYKGDIYILDIDTKKSRRLTAAGDAKGYMWTPEGTLLFRTMRDPALKKKAESGEEISCWYEISPYGGEAQLAFSIPLNVSRIHQMDEDRYVFTATFDNNRPDLEQMDEAERKRRWKN